MKILITLAVIYLTSSALGAEFPVNEEQISKNNAQHCFDATGMSDPEFGEFLKRQSNQRPSPVLTALTKCLYETHGAIVNGVINKDILRAMYAPGHRQKEFDRILEKCAKVASKTKNPDEVAFYYAVCVEES